MDYLAYKVRILSELGLKNTRLTEIYLNNCSRNAPTENVRRIRIDNAARKILADYNNGIRTYANCE